MANIKSKRGLKTDIYKNTSKKKREKNVSKKQQSQKRREKVKKTQEDKLRKSSAGSRANERRAGAVRAQNSTAVKAVRGGVEYIAQSHAQKVTKAFTSANKRAAETAGHGNRGKSGQVHAPTRSSDRAGKAQVKVTNTFRANEKKNKAKEQAVKTSNYKGNAAVSVGRRATKALDKANEKSLAMGASGFSSKKTHTIKAPVIGEVKFSNQDIYKGTVKGANEAIDYLVPYGGTAKGAIKSAETMLKAGKAAKAGKALTETAETGAKVLSKDGKKLVREYAEKVAKGENKTKAFDDVFKKVKKSDLKQNIKKELLANAMQDLSIGTGIDLAKGIEEGYTGKDLAKYMGENALLNVGLGAPISALAGRTGKAGKQALKNEIQNVGEQSLKAVTEENRLARRLGAKGYSPTEVQNAISKQEVQDYISPTAKEGKIGLTTEQRNHLNRLSIRLDAQKKAYDDAITESVNATKASIGKASAIDVARLRRAVAHYDTTGNRAMAKESRQLLKQAEKNFEGTLDTVTKAAANVSDAIKRDFKIESADECITAFGKTGGRVNDPSQFHGFAEFDKDGNIVGYHVNKDSEQALEYTFGHEFMHGFESLGKQYDDFVNDLKTFVGDEWDEAIDIARRDYANVKNADFEKEAVANLVAKHFFSEDGAYLKKLAGENPSLFARVYE
ncbi:MAG: hypothetical protein II489_03980, partial [Bacteroidaceae bacterium]|nr:hypothetical protein [Bacteroidaceae bacterium]